MSHRMSNDAKTMSTTTACAAGTGASLHAEAEAANAEILDHYKIPAASSDTGE